MPEINANDHEVEVVTEHPAPAAPPPGAELDLLGLPKDADSPVGPLSIRNEGVSREELAAKEMPLADLRDHYMSKEGGDVAYSLAKAVRKEEEGSAVKTHDPTSSLAKEWKDAVVKDGGGGASMSAADGGSTLPNFLAREQRPRSGSGTGTRRSHHSGLSGIQRGGSSHYFEGFAGQDLRDEDESDEDKELLLHGEAEEPSSVARNGDFSTFMTLVKAFVGPAHLYLAKAYAHAGVWTGIFGLILCCALNGYCVNLLVKAQAAARGQKAAAEGITGPAANLIRCSFAEVGAFAFPNWKGGAPMYWAVQAALVASQLGLVTMYYIFIAQSILDAVRNLTNCASWATGMSLAPVIFIQVVIQAPMALLRHLEQISFFAIVADVLILSGMTIIVIENARSINQNGHSHLTSFQSSTVSLFLGTAILTFEGIGLMLPIRDAMQNTERFVPLMSASMATCVGLFTVFALLGYMARGGDDVETNLLLALDQHNPTTQIVQFLYSVAVLLTFPLQAFPAYRIIEIAIGMRSGKGNLAAKWRKNGARFATLLLLAVLAWGAGSHLENFVSILGGLTMCPLAFVFPSLFHLTLCANTRKQRIIDWILVVGGVGIVFFVTGMAVKDWITGSPEKEPECVPK
eukprot:Hpha_TRINITY_DN15328_c4_g4::TRINITY_DN15328_c4_g4_i1::g.88175::m.88175/K14209/SLC36A, PAT; solute carrier family 36 (proton-coupled amino acid transporter)